MFDFRNDPDYIPFSGNYILNAQGEPEACRNIRVWGEFFEHDERRIVRQQHWDNADGEPVFVSTVFLAMDHNFWGKGPPVLWETMAWVGESRDEEVCQYRYDSREKAIGGHAAVVAMLGGTPLDEPVPAALGFEPD